MSSSKFDEKRRVAHNANPAAVTLMTQLSCKKASMTEVMSRINNGHVSPPKKGGVGAVIKGISGAKRRKRTESEEEEEFVVSDEEEEEDDDFDMEISDEEEPKRKRKPQQKKPFPMFATKASSSSSRSGKQSTLSDDSEDEKVEKKVNGKLDLPGGWLCKPRFAPGGAAAAANRMQTSKAAKKGEAKEKKKIAISSSEDEDEKGPAVDNPVVLNKAGSRTIRISSTPEMEQPLKLGSATIMEKNNKKERKKIGGAESEEEEADYVESEDEARRESDSEASDQEAGLSLRAQTLRADCLDFFNTATKESLLAAPRVVDKIALHVIASRPFDSFLTLEQSLSSIPRCSGRGLLEAYMEHLENRGVLERILQDCRVHSQDVTQEKTERVHLKLLNPEMTLHEYQQTGVDWLALMHRKNLNSILADEMGLGKTIQVVAFLSYLKQEKVRGPHLVVVPSSTVENWMNEIKKWSPTLKLITYYGSMDDRKRIRKSAKKRKETVDVLLTTYNMVGSRSDDRKFFKHHTINYVIYDEGHMLKNCSTDRYKSLMKIKSQRKILLTGTPLQNNLIELISLMYFTMTRIFTKYCGEITQLLAHFKQQRPALEGTDSLMYQQDRIEQAKAILQPYILRRVKSQVLSELPPKTEETVTVNMQPDQEDLYLDIVDSLKNDDGDPSNAYGGVTRLRQAANHPLLRRRLYDSPLCSKIAKTLCKKEKAYEKKNPEYVAEDLEALSDFQIHQLCEKYSGSCQNYLLEESRALESGKVDFLDKKLPEIKAKGDKVLIFSQFTSMLDILEVYLRAREYEFARLDGSTPVLERLEMINAFNSSPTSFVFLLSTRAGGLGINLTSANHIIIHDIDFNPYNDKQAEDRCHRMGQKKPVHVTRLISKDTVEVDIYRLACKKLQLEKDVTEGSRGLEDSQVSAAEAKDLLLSAVMNSPKKRRNSESTK